MEQRSIVLYLARKDRTAMEIDNDLVVTVGSDAKGNSSVTHFLREAKFPSPNPPTTFSEENPSLDTSSGAMLLVLTEQPFASVRQLSRLTHRSRSTVYMRQTQSLGFHVRHCR
jgi:hypothetical protein